MSDERGSSVAQCMQVRMCTPVQGYLAHKKLPPGSSTCGRGRFLMSEVALQCGARRGSPPVQGYLTHKKTPPPWDPTVALCLGTCGGPRRGGVSYERGTPVQPGAAPTSGSCCTTGYEPLYRKKDSRLRALGPTGRHQLTRPRTERETAGYEPFDFTNRLHAL